MRPRRPRSRIKARWWQLPLLFVGLLTAAAPAVRAQDGPLRTFDADLVPAGTLRAQIGFEFLRDINFPLTGLSGDLTSAGVLGLRLGAARVVEVQLQGTIQNFLRVAHQGMPLVPNVVLTGAHSTHDTGDFSLMTKVRVLPEKQRFPAVGLVLGFKLPDAKQIRGIGTNSTDVFAATILEKRFGKLKAFGNLGTAILQAPRTPFEQNDVFIYGAALSYPLYHKVNLVGEVAGRYSWREITAKLAGTESRSQGRFGLEFMAGGLTWAVAGIAGLHKDDPRYGVSFSVRKDIHIFGSGPLQ